MKTRIMFGILSLLLSFGIVSFTGIEKPNTEIRKTQKVSNIETFTFLSNGTETKGKIFVPDSYESNKNLPVIYLIDFAEQHFKLATDEFDQVIEGVHQIEGFDALVVSLDDIPNYNAEPDTFQDHYNIFKNMASYVDSNFTNNSSKTLIGRGSESGIVLMALFMEDQKSSIFSNFIAADLSPKYTSAIINLLENDVVPNMELNKKLHFSFSATNDSKQCIQLITLMNEAKFEWLEFESIEYSDSDYENTYPIAYADGLQYVFNK